MKGLRKIYRADEMSSGRYADEDDIPRALYSAVNTLSPLSDYFIPFNSRIKNDE